MTENKRFTVKPQNDLFGVNDNTAEYNVVNGIPTKIEAEWLCDTLNSLYKENGELKEERYAYLGEITLYKGEANKRKKENEQLKQLIKEAYNILQEADLFSDKAMNLDIFAYSEVLKFDSKDAYCIATGIKEALKILNEGDKMSNRWSKKTENTVQDCDGEEYNIDEIVKALNHYQDSVDSLSRENYDMYCLIEEFCLHAKRINMIKW